MGLHSGKYNGHWLLKLNFITMFIIFFRDRRYGIHPYFEMKVKY